MKILFTILFLLSFNLCLRAQTIDETAAIKYFELVDSLKKGKPLTQDTWTTFLGLEGNRLYIENQGFNSSYLEKYRKEMEIVYMPQNDSILQSKLKNRQNHFLTYVINQYKANEPELRKYLVELSNGKDNYLKAMYDNAYLMLPKGMQKKSPDAKLYIISIENDGIAHRGNIVLTHWLAYNYDKAKYGAVSGHELHHLLRKPKQYNVEEKDKGLLTILNKILNEGGPDLIDKKSSLSASFPEELQFGAYFLSTGEKALPKLDAAIKEIATGQKVYSGGDMNQLIGSSGHIPGFYMADVIERNGLKSKLIKNIHDPFQFFYLYNKAAKKDKANPFVFSDATMSYLKKVESEAKRKRSTSANKS
ncbi:DUF5700 domain-containing putative Zn-dependent protease [Rufibacter immobilis]|uniref:DUF5700 domain-containing putative Zn-dependent protease n=1 Tax=Rufibacter immobilis TaxID=1348778 RepID=UPI0035EAB2B3